MKNINCILFDCDGVLVDSEGITNQVLMDMTQPLGLELTLDEAHTVFNGKNLKDIFNNIEKRLNGKLPETFENDFRRLTFEAFKTDMKPIPGVIDFIDSLSVAYGVASNGPEEKIRLNLTTTGLIEKFENNIFSAYQINRWKPDPELYLHAAKTMGHRVQECIVIEDSLSGVIAAQRGGFKVYGLANPHSETQLKEAGAILFYNYEELAYLLKKEK